MILYSVVYFTLPIVASCKTQSFKSSLMFLAFIRLLILVEKQSMKVQMQTNPCCFIQAGTGDSDVSHGHIIDRHLCFGDTTLLLQAI